MKRLYTIFFLTSLLTVHSWAQQQQQGPPAHPQHIIEQFDTDGDGRLNQQESEAAHRFHQQRQGNNQAGNQNAQPDSNARQGRCQNRGGQGRRGRRGRNQGDGG